MEFDLVIIGGGPGGYPAAIRAAHFGYKVAIIEKYKLGGTCLHYGCIPTKVMFESSVITKILNNSKDFGIKCENFTINFQQILSKKTQLINQLENGIRNLLKNNKITVINGHGKLQDPNTIKVYQENSEELVIKTSNIIIATGSKPLIPNIPGIELKGVISSNEIFNLSELPSKLTIIGGGVIGIELGCIFNTLGSEVNIIEMLPNILPTIDNEITTYYSKIIKKEGIKLFLDSKVILLEKEPNTEKIITRFKNLKNNNTETIISDLVLVSIGRIPNIDDLGLENCGIELIDKKIKVNEYLETNVTGIYAIGDVIGGIMLAHVATFEGLIAVNNILNKNKVKVEYNVIPNCIFSIPEIASVGFTEDELKQKGIKYKIGKFPNLANSRSLIMGETRGFTKIICDENNKILGVHIIGPHATDMISEASLAMKNNLTINDLIKTIHPHPTLSETIFEAGLDLFGYPIHILKRR